MPDAPSPDVTAIVAGGGLLPKLLVKECTAKAQNVVVVNLDSVDLDWLAGLDVIKASIEKIGSLFCDLKSAGVSRVIFAGAVQRPQLDPTKFDAKFQEIAPRLLPAIQAGDDKTLTMIATVFEAEGFDIIAPQDMLGGLIAQAGVLGAVAPSADDKNDARRAGKIVSALGRLDVGQGAVVAQGLCLAIESIQGTDTMLDFVADTAKGYRPDPGGAKGVLFKGPKPGQDMRFDVPTIGPGTIESAAGAGLAGVCIVAGGVIVLDRAKTIKTADELGLFIWVVDPDQTG